MQISALNSVNFKGGSSATDATFKFTQEELNATKKFLEDTESDIAISKKIRETLSPNNNKKGDKKNAFEIIASVGATFLAAFLLSKKLYKRGGEAVSNLKDKFSSKSGSSYEAIKGLMKSVSNKVSGINKKINEKIPVGVKNKLNGIKNIGFINPIFDKTNANHTKAVANTVGIIGGAAGTAYVANADNDGNGEPDIFQKNISALQGAVNRAGVISDLVKALT